MSKFEVYDRLFRENSYEEFEAFCRFNLFHHHHYKPFNCALIMAQRPGARNVQTERAWNNRGYALKPEAIPIVIMQVNGPVTLVYDEEDVYSIEPQLEAVSSYQPENPYDDKPPLLIGAATLTNWIALVQKKGIRTALTRMGDRQHGKAELLSPPIPLTYTETEDGTEKDHTVQAHFQITLSISRSAHDQALTLLHELGHLYCGHVSGTRTKTNGIPKYRFAQQEQQLTKLDSALAELQNRLRKLRDEKEKSAEYDALAAEYDRQILEWKDFNRQCENQREYEAQMVCMLLCERNRISDEMSADYLKQHTENGMLPEINLGAVLEAAEKIASILNI